jgi:hypothetical protein
MKIINLSTVEELISEINPLANHYIYRGQSDASWRLETTLQRASGNKFQRDFTEKVERYSLDNFSARFHLYDRENNEPQSSLEWLSLMQHYGVPTRLLDFTESPYAALYFGIEGYDFQRQPEFALYCIDYTGFMDRSIELIKREDNRFTETRVSIQGKSDKVFDDFIDPFNRNILWVTEPNRLNARIDRQAGCFLVSGNKAMGIQELIESESYSDVDCRKIILSGSVAQSAFALLRKMNISGKSIYGDLGGLARSLALQIRIYAA